MVKPKQSDKNSKLNDSQNGADEWDIVGWLNATKKGAVYAVALGDGDDSELLGFVRASQLERLVNGEIGGCPIKKAPSK